MRLSDIDAAIVTVVAGTMVIAALISELPPDKRAFCGDCELAVTGKGCMRRPRLRRGRARRQRHGGSRLRARGPPSGDDADGGGGVGEGRAHAGTGRQP